MEQCDILIRNGMVLTMDAENRVIDSGWVAVEGDRIARVGGSDQAAPGAAEVIDARGGLVLPGLVNGHTHAAMTLFRGLADDLPLMDWLNHYIFPVESRMDADFVYSGTLLACAEMILSGTTTFCDMYLFEDAVARAAQAAGMRCLVGEVLYDFPSPNYGPIERGFEYTEHLIRKWRDDPLVSIAVEPHATFTCSPKLLERARDLAARHDVPLIIHLAETAQEVVEVRARHGRTPARLLHDLGLLGPRLIADHCVQLEEAEIELLADHRVKVIHNPESNMKLASGIAPIPKLLKRGVFVGLGTDGCASNNNLDLFGEMGTAARLHKVRDLDPTAIDALTVLRMATIEGARALGMADRIGSLERGKQADIIVLDTDRPHLTPLYNPFSQLVYAARGSDVTHTLIHGRVVMANRRLFTLDLESVMARAREKSADVLKWVGKKA